MKICIYGAGAIGGLLGVKLSLAGVDVGLVARGATLEAIREGGLRLRIDGEELHCRPTCTDEPAALGPQDFVIVTTKANAAPAIAAHVTPLLGPDTAVVTAMNGLPWWYFHELPGTWEKRRLEAVDPGGVQWDTIGPERAIGCVVYAAMEVVEPGLLRHVAHRRFPLGEPDGRTSDRVRRLSAALVEAGLEAPVLPKIRDEIWTKLLGNLSFNPISALTHATLSDMATDPGTRAVARAMMVEAQAVATRLGVRFEVDVDERISRAIGVGAHKTSMLQDLERGRPMEIDAIVASVQEVAHMLGVETPYIDAILALVRQRARVAGCYPA